DHARRFVLEDVRRGAIDGHPRRDRDPWRRGPRRRRVHPAPEPRLELHRAVDADPRGDLRPLRPVRPRRDRRRAPGLAGAPIVRSAAALALDGLERRFGALMALNGVTLSVAPRERRAIIGPNGAGKTTLFNLITGHLAPTAGRIVLDGAA